MSINTNITLLASAIKHLDFIALTTHIETNEVSIKDILSPSYDVSAFRPKHS